MAFRYNIAPEGPPGARVAVVCEKPAREEVARNRLLVGETGRLVRQHLKRAGLDAGDQFNLSKEVWLTNSVQSFDSIGNPTPDDVIREQPRLYRELCSLPNLTVVIPMGAIALSALSNFKFSDPNKRVGAFDDITHRRGSVLRTAFGTKMVPTFHPSFYIRGKWELQPVVQFDVNRAIEESHRQTISRTVRYHHIKPTFQEALSWLNYLKNYPISQSPYISYDLETVRGGRNGTWYISCIAFAATPTEAFCIPMLRQNRSSYWPDISQESVVWLKIAELLSLPNRKYVGQNLSGFDNWVLRRHGIAVPYITNGFDTYSAHSLLAPDLPHDLAFIVSIYTDEEFYKIETGRDFAFGLIPLEQLWLRNCKDAALTLESALGMIKDMKES